MVASTRNCSKTVSVVKKHKKTVSIHENQMTVYGRPFRIQGVTYSKTPTDSDFSTMLTMGVNTIRTWGSDECTQRLLDTAARHNIKVLVGIWMRHGRPGNEGDDSFDWVHDECGKKEQMQHALEVVSQFKKHEAVLGWAIGNEVTLNIGTESEKIAYAKFLERVCAAVKLLDLDHFVSSVSAWTTDIPYWEKFCSSLDVYGVNAYGYGAYVLPKLLLETCGAKPFYFGEFGVTGEWDALTDENGVKVEPGDEEKYLMFAKHWPKIDSENKTKSLGGFLFNYGDGFSFAGIWLNFFVKDLYRPAFWGARKAFTGKDPDYPLSVINKFTVADVRNPEPGSWLEMHLSIKTKEVKEDEISFFYNQRSGTRSEKDKIHPLIFEPVEGRYRYRVKLPHRSGSVKLYAFYKDGLGNLAIASTSTRIGQ
jgi:hypothetical protein